MKDNIELKQNIKDYSNLGSLKSEFEKAKKQLDLMTNLNKKLNVQLETLTGASNNQENVNA